MNCFPIFPSELLTQTIAFFESLIRYEWNPIKLQDRDLFELIKKISFEILTSLKLPTSKYQLLNSVQNHADFLSDIFFFVEMANKVCYGTTVRISRFKSLLADSDFHSFFKLTRNKRFLY